MRLLTARSKLPLMKRLHICVTLSEPGVKPNKMSEKPCNAWTMTPIMQLSKLVWLVTSVTQPWHPMA